MPSSPKDKRFTPDRVKSILTMIGKHIPYKKACLSNGVSERQFYNWIKQGEKDLEEGLETEYTALLIDLNSIEALRIEGHLENLKHNENGHKGAQWVLERVFWKYFSPKVGEIDLNERVEKLELKKEEGKDGDTDEKKEAINN